MSDLAEQPWSVWLSDGDIHLVKKDATPSVAADGALLFGCGGALVCGFAPGTWVIFGKRRPVEGGR